MKMYVMIGRYGANRGITHDLALANQFLNHQPAGRKVLVYEAEELVFDPTMAPPAEVQSEPLHVWEDSPSDNLGLDSIEDLENEG